MPDTLPLYGARMVINNSRLTSSQSRGVPEHNMYVASIHTLSFQNTYSKTSNPHCTHLPYATLLWWYTIAELSG